MSELIKINQILEDAKLQIQEVLNDPKSEVGISYTITPPNPKWCDLQTDAIINCVCEVANISKVDIIGRSRRSEYAYPRHIAIALIRKYKPEISLNSLGKIFSNRGHSTMIHSLNHVDNMAFNNSLRILYNKCDRSLYQVAL